MINCRKTEETVALATKQGQYVCNTCNKVFTAFTTRQSHTYHLSIHTGQYRFTCQNCDKGFNRKDEFEKHLKLHI